MAPGYKVIQSAGLPGREVRGAGRGIPADTNHLQKLTDSHQIPFPMKIRDFDV